MLQQKPATNNKSQQKKQTNALVIYPSIDPSSHQTINQTIN